MRDKLRWLAVPPALALLLMFGPWRAASPGVASRDPALTVPRAAEARSPQAADPQKPDPQKPDSQRPDSQLLAAQASKVVAAPLPDLTQVMCTVAGVCLLGAAVVVALARSRRQRTGGGTTIVLRQSLRMSNRHAVHAVQFDDKILLLGECDGSLRVLHAGDDPELAPARKLAAAVEPEDDGAVLKDMVIPRPPAPGVAARGSPRPAHVAEAPAPKSPSAKKTLADFRTLLGKTQVQA